ncbi:LYR motif containing protein 1 [Lingula anatina]|uniref:LYR motif containing protein 1 n=1 Tax=Lingula anatina TaxID=7574 RepID=A0A1S3HIU0_LINAN|nr:LYR motif containing protein 1 [Lingula anatina]|eukprot:XP_013386023.1 LYR motif containing protein 1 [Lingula anatina]
MAHRKEVLSLYRRILQLARTWESVTADPKTTADEKQFIKDEAKQLFRKNKFISDEKEIKDCMKEAETRIEMALHYKIPYARMVNFPQHSVLPPGPGRKKGKLDKKLIQQSKPIYVKSLDPDKS